MITVKGVTDGFRLLINWIAIVSKAFGLGKLQFNRYRYGYNLLSSLDLYGCNFVRRGDVKVEGVRVRGSNDGRGTRLLS